MLLHIDGSVHRWFGDDRSHELMVILDDATSEIYYAQLVEAESTRSVMVALREVIETRACSAGCTATGPGTSSLRRSEGRRWTGAVRHRSAGFYGQDSWRATAKLTLNYGLHYEYWSPWRVPRNITVSWDETNGDLLYALQNPLD